MYVVAARLIGRTTQATNEAFKKLTTAGVLEQLNIGRHRNRAYEAPAIVDAFTAFVDSAAHRRANPQSRRV
jgi:hypothetical protein